MKLNLTYALASVCVGAALVTSAGAHPEFQKYSQATSGRTVNCAMCHVHSDGPVGAGRGQIGSLTPEQMARLNQARSAFEPGRPVDSPVLNAFGNRVVESVGKTRLLDLRGRPGDLAAALGMESDLDADGVPDAREYLEGTHPLVATNGNPWVLFVTNLTRYGFHLTMIVAATALTIFGLASLLKGAHVANGATEADEG